MWVDPGRCPKCGHEFYYPNPSTKDTLHCSKCKARIFWQGDSPVLSIMTLIVWALFAAVGMAASIDRDALIFALYFLALSICIAALPVLFWLGRIYAQSRRRWVGSKDFRQDS